MPHQYVEELRSLPARPALRTPTVALHGMLDNDDGGGTIGRVQEWLSVNKQFLVAFYSPECVQHSLEPWLSSAVAEDKDGPVPSLAQLWTWCLEGGQLSR